ncbi:hypothetical protein GA0115234_100661 [Streptomyces sp. DvalAA-43]|nr:hypothetical protein GA0115234_100661 [Streptomyces sp. DvalAA-43]
MRHAAPLAHAAIFALMPTIPLAVTRYGERRSPFLEHPCHSMT